MTDDLATTKAEVLKFVKTSIENLATWKKEPSAPPTVQDVEALLGDDLPRGPADVTSFHDFYALNIAFDHVWEEVCGDEIGQLAQDLYAWVVRETQTQPESGTRYLFSIELQTDGPDFVAELNARTVSAELRDAFRQQGEPLGSEAQVETEGIGSAWKITSGDESYLVKKENGTLDVYAQDVLIYGLADVERLLAEARSVLDQRVALAGVPAAVKEFLPQITAEMWGALGFEGRKEILALLVESQLPEVSATATVGDQFEATFWARLQGMMVALGAIPETAIMSVKLREMIDQIKARELSTAQSYKEEALNTIQDAVEASTQTVNEGDTTPLIEKVAQALKEPHAFKVFAADSVNFAVLLNYRQEWDPQTYQVGELVNTIPLAPKEVRKYTKKQTHKESRKKKEINNALSIRRGDTSLTGRSETEVVRRANEKSAFDASANASGSIGFMTVGGSTSLHADSAKESARTKKNFREAVTKSAQELKSEQKLEVELSSSTELEDTVTGEISNPNEEIAVTYLFYELQRRYKVCEYLRDATPVILVANHVPNPDEIDEAWLLRYEWILRRVILDDEFLIAFNLLKKARSGKNIEIDTLRTHVEHQLRAFQDTKIELETYTKTRAATERELRAAVEKYADAVSAEQSTIQEMGGMVSQFLSPGGIFGSVSDFFFGSPGIDADEPPEESAEAAQARQEAVEEALSRIDRSIADTRTRLQGISTALDQAIDKYMVAVRTRLDGELALMKLRVHVKDNILYYMQAIWDHEPPDQRYFRLCDVRVPMLEDPGVELQLMEGGAGSPGWFNATVQHLDIPQMVTDQYFTTLKEIADLDHLLGYKGNYMIFPLTAEHPLTTYMMQDYLDEHGQIRDPDQSMHAVLLGQPKGSVWSQFEAKATTERLQPKIVALEEQQKAGAIAKTEYAQAAHEVRQGFRNEIQTYRQELLKEAQSEVIVVPSDLLFIAVLPGTHPILENFKLLHRAIDLLRAAAELEEHQVELIRLKARLMSLLLGDPEIDKRVEITSKGGPVSAGDVGVGEVVAEVDDADDTEPEPEVDD